MTAKSWRPLLLWPCVWLVLVFCSSQVAQVSLLNSLKASLQQSLPEKIISAEINALKEDDVREFLVKRIDDDLGEVATDSLVPVIRSVAVRVRSLQAVEYGTADGEDDEVVIDWTDTGKPRTLTLGVHYDFNLLLLYGMPLVLVLAMALLYERLPSPLSESRHQVWRCLVERGVTARKAKELVRGFSHWDDSYPLLFGRLLEREGSGHEQALQILDGLQRVKLDESRFDWFLLGLDLHHNDVDRAVAIAKAQPRLELRVQESTAVCHGVIIPFSQTPFFYLCWYARRRLDGVTDGWFTNPPSNRGDVEAAVELLALLEKYDGNGRAVRELRENGLRSKILDQNRSKIKDEIVAVLGEALAVDYLFEQERDSIRGRNRYRLIVPPAQLSIC